MEELEEKVGGNYEDFIADINDIKIAISSAYDNCTSHLGEQIAEETMEAFTNILKKYEIQKDIEIISQIEK